MKSVSFVVFMGITLISSISAQGTNTFPASGNVGIGTAAPQSTLHLQSSAAYTPSILLESTNTTAGSGSYVILQKTKSGSLFAAGDVLGTLLANGISNAGSQQASYLTFVVDAAPSTTYLPGALSFVTHNSDGSGTEKLRITSKGKLGIGTSTPDALVQLAGYDAVTPIALTMLNRSSAGTMVRLERSSGAEGGSLIWDNNNVVFSVQTGASIPLAFKIGGAEQMRIDAQGNVGIGTSNPMSKLAVAGAITAKEVVVQTTGWSDYVFDTNYPLQKLDALKAAIDRDGHLPGIPSAQEVAVKGVSVGDMQAKLLAKVEESTLYILQLEQENRELRKRLDKIEQVLEKK